VCTFYWRRNALGCLKRKCYWWLFCSSGVRSAYDSTSVNETLRLDSRRTGSTFTRVIIATTRAIMLRATSKSDAPTDSLEFAYSSRSQFRSTVSRWSNVRFVYNARPHCIQRAATNANEGKCARTSCVTFLFFVHTIQRIPTKGIRSFVCILLVDIIQSKQLSFRPEFRPHY